MIIVDVNVLLAAYRDDHPYYAIARPWFESVLESGESVAVPDTVWVSFIRLATNRRVFEIPVALEDAFLFVDAVISHPGYIRVNPLENHLTILKQLCADADATGDLVPDAALAAIAIENGCTLASFDRDFARFEGLDWVIPGAE